MTTADCEKKLYDLLFTAGVNQRYHQRLSGRWTSLDRGVRIAVGFLALVGLLCATIPAVPFWISLITATASLAVAIVLNIIPLGDWACLHKEQVRRWTELRCRIEKARAPLVGADSYAKASKATVVELQELIESNNLLDAAEPTTPNNAMLKEAFAQEMESHWGEGICSSELAEKERQRRLTDLSGEVAAVVVGAERG